MKGGIDLTGQRFGKLLVLNECDNYKCKCLCDCGNTSIINKYNLISGNTKSCGCLGKNNASTHGKSKTRLYSIYTNIKTRCYNKNATRYDNWGGRGITMCDEWKNDFMTFHNWSISHGYSDKLTIDRIDNNKGYSPDNCRWVTVKQQCENRRNNANYTINDDTHCLKYWCNILQLNYNTVRGRLKSGWSIKRALNITHEVIKNDEGK